MWTSDHIIKVRGVYYLMFENSEHWVKSFV